MKTITDDTYKLLALSFIKGVGPAALRNAMGVNNFKTASIDTIANQVPRIASALNNSPNAWDLAEVQANDQVELAKNDGGRILSIMDAEYPKLLKMTKDDPIVLFVKGELTCPSNDSDDFVALIGTREPTPHGEVITARIAEFFIANRWSIVSGLALGCDTVAHERAISLRGHAIAVLAHGLHTISPSRNKALAHAILDQGGALVTEYPYGQGPTPHQFVKRDRTQAGMSRGVVMVQSDLAGGSLHASRASISYGRWLAVPQPTAKDIAQKESKVQANSLISEGSPESICEFLSCDEPALDRVKVIRGRDDYPSLLQLPSEPADSGSSPEQDSLF